MEHSHIILEPITVLGESEIWKEKSGSLPTMGASIHSEEMETVMFMQIVSTAQKWSVRNWNMAEMEKLQQVVRCLRSHGGKVNSSCGMHVHVDASNHTPRSLKNALTIMYSKEDILFKALQVNPSRVEQWCKKVRENVLEDIRKMPSGNMSMDKFRQLWYEERRMGGRSHSHYDDTRYYALNLHAVFDKGTVEWRCFNSTLHAGKVRANITLALAISAQAINQKCTHMRKTEISENPCFTFRTFLLRLGLIGPEYKNVRKHLLDHLEGDKAWRYDKNTYECLKRKQEER